MTFYLKLKAIPSAPRILRKKPRPHGAHIVTAQDEFAAHYSVYLNGIKVERAIYANSRRGIVRVIDPKPRIHKYKKRLLHRTLHGVVEITMPPFLAAIKP